MGLASLTDRLDLEQLDRDLFRGFSPDDGRPMVFGGQVAAQSLVAAVRTTEGEASRPVHSLHAYFLRPGDPKIPIIYHVDRIRDGRSFTTRRVVAKQRGQAIFNMAASFQRPEPGKEHQADPPDVPGPHGLPSELDLIRRVEDRIPEEKRDFYTRDRPIEVRPVDPADPFDPQEKAPERHLWFRAQGALPDDARTHRSVLAYASDYGLLGTALRPHGLSFVQPELQLASLDHALWFHRDVRLDDWLLYAMESPSASGARGYTRGQIFTEDGTLVASVAQEGLMRLRDDRDAERNDG